MKILLIFCCMLMLNACSASKLPPELTKEQTHIVDGKYYNCVIGIERYKWPVYSDSLSKAIKDSRIFKDVVWTESGSHYDFIARVEDTVLGTSTIPILAILTLGIIPTVVTEEHGHVFSLQTIDLKSEKLQISTKYSGNTILGWVAIPMTLLPSISAGKVEDTSTYTKYLSYKLISNADKLLVSASK